MSEDETLQAKQNHVAQVQNMHHEIERLKEELRLQSDELKSAHGVQTGKVRCNAGGCDFGEAPAEYRHSEYIVYLNDLNGNQTAVPSTTHHTWELQGDANCPKCSSPLSEVAPGAADLLDGKSLLYPRRMAPWEMADA